MNLILFTDMSVLILIFIYINKYIVDYELLYPSSVVCTVAWMDIIAWVVGCVGGGMLNWVGCQSDWALDTFCGRTFLLFILFSPFYLQYMMRPEPSLH